MKRYTLAAVAALLVVLPWRQTVRAGAPLYTVENLGTFTGQVPGISGINAFGQVAGNVMTNGSMAVRYTDGAGWQALPGLDTRFSVATGINAAGDVVGYHFTAANQLRAFRYHAGVVQDIDPLPGGSTDIGFAINDAGGVVGYSDGTAGAMLPFAASGTTAAPLPTLGGAGFACGVNVAGQIAGASATPTGAVHAMRIDPGAAAPVEILSTAGAPFAVNACAIDAAGRVGGQMALASGRMHAFRYADGAGVLDLDTFNSSVSNVESMAAGVSAGWYLLADGIHLHAFAHRDLDGSFDLNARIDAASGWVLSAARAINESGVIAGEGTLNGQPAVFRLRPSISVDTTPPVITSVTATPGNLWPPNNKMVAVSIAVAATDDDHAAPVCALTRVSGAPAADIVVTGPLSANVRASKNADDGLRTYVFGVSCHDRAGNTASGSVGVSVARDESVSGLGGR